MDVTVGKAFKGPQALQVSSSAAKLSRANTHEHQSNRTHTLVSGLQDVAGQKAKPCYFVMRGPILFSQVYSKFLGNAVD